MGGGLTLAVCIAILFYTLAVSANFYDDTIIQQVTEEEGQGINGENLLMRTHERKFQMFIKQYGKEYSSKEEYVHRLGIFAKNVLRAAEHQALDPTAIHGVTPFSDLSEEEFESRFFGLKRVGSLGANEIGDEETAPILDVDDLPTNFDWREKGAVTPVKMQGICGACWAFTTTGAIEGANFLATGKLVSLSEQQLVDCDHTCDLKEKDSCDSGCDGGLMTNAYKYLMEAGGLQDEKSYPYEGKKRVCRFKPEQIAAKVINFTNIPLDEDQIAANLVRHGPLAVGINAVFMQTYIGGVSCPLICSKKRLNHGVLLVGYRDKGFSILRLGNRPYWIIKNSWGKHWGDHGYYKLCKGEAMCGMNTMVSAVATVTT
ncbi:cathepsin F [Ranunculus cassubicifolius]